MFVCHFTFLRYCSYWALAVSTKCCLCRLDFYGTSQVFPVPTASHLPLSLWSKTMFEMCVSLPIIHFLFFWKILLLLTWPCMCLSDFFHFLVRPNLELCSYSTLIERVLSPELQAASPQRGLLFWLLSVKRLETISEWAEWYFTHICVGDSYFF